MKKGTKILFIILGIIVTIAIWFFVMWKMTGAQGFSKTPVTEEEFSTAMENKGLEIYDATSQVQQDYFNSCLIAYNDELQVEYYSLTSESYAEQFYSSVVTSLREESAGTLEGLSNNKMVAFGNYATFTQTNDGTYYYISRVDNTVVCVGVDEELKSDVEQLINIIKY